MIKLKQIGIDLEVNARIEASRQSFSESENDILRRLLLSPPEPQQRTAPITKSPLSQPVVRRRGSWTVEYLGDRIPAANLQDAYKKMLERIVMMDKRFLERFSEAGSRSRRYVARQPEHLYATAPHLAQKHAKPLVPGWFFDSNLSSDQVGKRLRVAARLTHLEYGRNMRILEGLREI